MDGEVKGETSTVAELWYYSNHFSFGWVKVGGAGRLSNSWITFKGPLEVFSWILCWWTAHLEDMCCKESRRGRWRCRGVTGENGGDVLQFFYIFLFFLAGCMYMRGVSYQMVKRYIKKWLSYRWGRFMPKSGGCLIEWLCSCRRIKGSIFAIT